MAGALAPADGAGRGRELACPAAVGREATAKDAALGKPALANRLAMALGVNPAHGDLFGKNGRCGARDGERTAAGKYRRRETTNESNHTTRNHGTATTKTRCLASVPHL